MVDHKEMRKAAKQKLEGYCKVCPVCNGKVCSGEVPGMGGLGTGEASKVNHEALAEFKLNMRTIHNAKNPDTTVTLFGQKFDSPIQAAPMTGTPYNMGGQITEEEFITNIIKGSLEAGTIGWSGDGADPTMYDSGLKAVKEANGMGIPIIKPRDQEAIKERLKRAEAAGALAVGIDIDGAGLVTMALKGQPVGPKTKEELQEVIQMTELPFILKGIMTPEEAELAVEIGAKAIVVSNHGGRVLDHTPGVADVLPEIAEVVKGKITIFADGAVRTGSDVLKLIALGADAVLVGRPLVVGAFGAGTAGVAGIITKMNDELKHTMLLTGCATIKDIDEKVLY